MKHNFDKLTNRRNSDAKKYDERIFPADVLPMWIADMDFECPKPIVDAVVKRAREAIYGYPYNSDRFEAAACYWMQKRFSCQIKSEQIQSVPGTIPGIAFALRAMTNEDDGILIQTPCYPPFRQIISNNKRQIVENRLILENGKYRIDFLDFEKKLSQGRIKAFLLCNPQNPTGRVFTKDELFVMVKLCLKYRVFIISDEIHCDIVYTHNRHTPLCKVPNIDNSSFVMCINPSKTFNIAGLRTAAIIDFSKEIHSKIEREIAANKAYGRTVFGALAFEVAYFKCEYYADQLIQYLYKNLQLVQESFSGDSPIQVIKPEGTFLVWLDCRRLCFSQQELESFFLKQAKVGLNSGISFGADGIGFMRMNIAVPKPILVHALCNIKNAIKSLKDKGVNDVSNNL